MRLRGKALGSGLWGAGVWLLIDSLNSERTRQPNADVRRGVGVRGDANAKGRERREEGEVFEVEGDGRRRRRRWWWWWW